MKIAMISVFLVSLIPYYIYIFSKIKKNVHMMQQNSYMNVRYRKWLSTQKKTTLDFIPALSIPAIFATDMGALLAVILWFMLYSTFLLTINKAPAKKKLVYTKRAVRLFITNLAIFIIPTSALIISLLVGGMDKVYLAIVLGLIMLFPALNTQLSILANDIITPYEKSINMRFYKDAQKIIANSPNLMIVGITGSYGKTSMKHALNCIMQEKYHTLMPPGSYNTPMGLTKVIREQLNPTYEVLLAEMGAKLPGDIKELCDLVHPKYGIITVIGKQHMETFKTIDNVANTKFELVDSLPSDGIAVLNFDDELIQKNAHRMKGKFVSYGLYAPDADYTVTDIKYHNRGSEFTVIAPNDERQVIKTKLLGEHNIHNILGAIAMAHHLGVSLPMAKRGIARLNAVEHRLDLKMTDSGIAVINDAFNANPVGAKMALDVLDRMSGGKKIIITPGMIELGDKEDEENRIFGQHCAGVCDYIILVGKKQTHAIKEGIMSQGYPEEKLYVAENLNDANAHMRNIVKPGDIVLYENDLPDTYNE